MKAFLIALLMFIIAVAHASKDTFFTTTPLNTTAEQALNAVKYAASKRGWTIHDTVNNTVQFELKHRGYNAVLDLSVSGNEIRYFDSTTTLKIEDEEETYGPPVDIWESTPVPRNWLINLQNDTNTYFYLRK